MTSKQMEIVGHSLGINVYNARETKDIQDTILPRQFYRNNFVVRTDKHHDFSILSELEKLNYMGRYTKFGDLVFYVTDKGIEDFRKQFKAEITDTFVPLKKSKQEYQDYLNSENDCSYDEWLGIQLPKFLYGKEMCEYAISCDGYYSRGVIMVSTKYDDVKGEFCSNKKLAKASYKKALKEYLSKKNHGKKNKT